MSLGSEDVAPVSVVTLNAGRDRHLLRLAAGLGRCDPRPAELVVVSMGDPLTSEVAIEVERHVFPTEVRRVAIPLGPAEELPLAAARNAGAEASSQPTLLYLDVDCIPGVDTVGAYADAIDGGAVVAGPVRWLERWWDHDIDGGLPTEALLRSRSAPHPVRPVPTAVLDDDRHELLWSLASGIRRADLLALGGFDDGYVGYGAEDTDLGMRARRAGLVMRWLPAGTAYHQWHPSSDPPVEHVDAIVRNARRFHDRWGAWPMTGWLAAFRELGLVDWDPEAGELSRGADPTPPHRPTVVPIPACHPYVRHVLPDGVEARPDPTTPWWPHPALEPGWVAENVRPGSVVHLHFGFEHRSVEEMQAWCEALDRIGAALVVTVHDVDNPHCSDLAQDEHHRRTAVVVGAADEVLTLSRTAADEVARRWGRTATVVAHPHVAAVDHAIGRGRAPTPTIGVDLKALRAGLLDPRLVIAGLAEGAPAGARTVVHLEDGLGPTSTDAVARAADSAGIELVVAPPPDDPGLVERVASFDVALLPYRTGTHSGLLELCRDVGTRAVVPAHGGYRDQWDEVVTFDATTGGDTTVASIASAVRRAVALGPPPPDPPGWRLEQREALRREHLDIYRRLADRCST